MTESDDRLAPVTQLFGSRAGARRPEPSGSGTDDGWAVDDRPGADEFDDDGAPGSDGRGAAGSASRGAAGPDGRGGVGLAGRAAAGPARHGARGPDGGGAPGLAGRSADPVGSTPASRSTAGETGATLTALPTYAAFAATTEAPGSPAVSFRDGGGDNEHGRDVGAGATSGSNGDTDDDDATEPPESLDAAKQRAENISLHALSRRGVSSHEMAKTLRSRDLPEEVVEAEVERLERVGLLDDAELAENLVRTKQERKGLGKGAITSELRQRGLAPEAIEAAIADIDDDEEQARADEWAAKRAGQLRGLDQATAERRLNGFLMRRGYRSEVIRRAVERALPRGGSGGRGGVRFD